MNKSTTIEYKYLEKYMHKVRANGCYSFTLDDLKNEFELSYKTIKQALYRLKVEKKAAQIRQGFYVFIPPEYSAQGMLPADLFVNDMMNYLRRPYYIGLLSAAALHGAAHQQPMTYFVVSQSPAPRNICNKNNKIVFLAKRKLLFEGVIQKKTPAGYINVSSPELTAFDLLDNIRLFGINRITAVLQELYEEMRPPRLVRIAKHIDNKANIQRLGYLLETMVNEKKLVDPLYEILTKSTFSHVPLSPQKGRKGTINNKWKIIINMQIESDI